MPILLDIIADHWAGPAQEMTRERIFRIGIWE